MTNQPAPTSSNYDDWLIDELAKQPAAQSATDHAAAAAHRASLINCATLYQLQNFLEDQRTLQWFNSISANGGTWVGGVDAPIVLEAWDSDLELAEQRMTALYATQPTRHQ